MKCVTFYTGLPQITLQRVTLHMLVFIVILQLLTDSTQKPGPGAHYPEKVHINKKSPPRFSMGIRHSDYITPLILEDPE